MSEARKKSLRALAREALLAALLSAVVAAPAQGAPPHSVGEHIQQAQAAYDAAEYEQAARLYRDILASGWTSSALLYNAGCAAYKAGETGWSVYYFEEARRRSPRDPEIRHNLRLALSRVRDRRTEEADSGMLTLLADALDAYSPADVVSLLLALLWALAAVLGVHWFAGASVGPWTGRGLRAIGVAALVAVAALLVKLYQVHSAPSAVVVAEQVAVRSGPREEESARFMLHGGTLLHEGRAAGDWQEIWLTPEMRGWLPRASLARLSASGWLP